jgi:beta-galactosidase
MYTAKTWNGLLIVSLLLVAVQSAKARTEFTDEFAPSDGIVSPQERPFRDEVCLNGSWQFEPVAIPAGYVRDQGTPPEVPMPVDGGWDKTPCKIPSPWNVNIWGNGRNVGAGTDRSYWPGSLYFPSYPKSWDSAQMGWLRRSFRVPGSWGTNRLLLHFEAVAGDCQVFVNGKLAGSHFDKYLPFDLDVTDLIRRDGDNELLVGVRAYSLFNLQSKKYEKMRTPYPCGSSTEPLAGIWQDVYLLALSPARVQSTFVKPLVDQGLLEVEISVQNDSDQPQQIHVGGTVSPWVNLAGSDVMSAPQPKWRIGDSVLSLPGSDVTVGPKTAQTITLRQSVGNELKLWAPGHPNLYAVMISAQQNGKTIDQKVTRFGWRQFKIDGSNLLLNGQKIQLTGDLLHPFGPMILSRRYAWAWYKMIQDVGGNSVRLHAQIHPRHYLELADEMGLVVLDETAIFGSAVSLNFEPDIAWRRFADHYDGLILRDRNHPSVLGWSVGNELFAIFNLNHVSPEDADHWYRQLADLALHARTLDPTRQWISCDGDEDLRGTLPVYSKHFGLGLPFGRLPANLNKPMMVGESGGTYYARPAELAIFNGNGAYQSYATRNDALGIDVYDNIVHMAKPKLAYYSPSETAWFGIEHLPLGYHDFSRLPTNEDGVFFTAPFVEGKPGIQPERLPPYVATLNPGWDADLPLYKPLGMFKAEQAALAADGPRACEWDHRSGSAAVVAPVVTPKIEHVGFVGDLNGALAHRLTDLGVPLAAGIDPTGDQPLVLIDGETFRKRPADQKLAADLLHGESVSKGTVLLFTGSLDATADGDLNLVLPMKIHLTDRTATALTNDVQDPWTATFSLPHLYFAEQSGSDRNILHHGLEGPLVDHAHVLLQASNTDWSLFNNVPEIAKCGAEVLYEQMKKPAGAALAEMDSAGRRIAVCSIDFRNNSSAAQAMWRTLFTSLGVKLGVARSAGTPAFDESHALGAAMAIGRFSAGDLDAALASNDLGDALNSSRLDQPIGNHRWTQVEYADHDRFLLNQFDAKGSTGPSSIYLSCWIKSPRALDELLAGGPDVPHLSMRCYVSQQCRLFVNGHEITPGHTEAADYRTLYTFDNLPLTRDWNHVVLKVVSATPNAEPPFTIAARLSCNSTEYLQQIETAVQHAVTAP